jgi:membrane associated rhomboid family serine protease
MRKLFPVLVFVGLCWLVFVVNNVMCRGYFSHYGIVPRTILGLRGILVAPFLHASFAHILANTVPLLILGSVIALRSPRAYVGITLIGAILSGAFTWLLARPGCHIGASGLVFCYFGYILEHAWLQRTPVNIVLAVGCGFLYGGLIWGLSPFQTGVSWEGHVTGLIAGLILAWIGRTPKAAIEPGGTPPRNYLAH